MRAKFGLVLKVLELEPGARVQVRRGVAGLEVEVAGVIPVVSASASRRQQWVHRRALPGVVQLGQLRTAPPSASTLAS